MKSNKFGLLSLLLWIATVATFAWFFIHGNTTAGTDRRTAIVLKASEREFVLSEMRGMLVATQGIMEGANRGDMQAVIKAASAAGMGVAADANPALIAKLPLDFKTLGMSVHQDMDDIAKAAAAGTPTAEILKMESNTLTKCIACHSVWQLQAVH
ncbi:MAG: hypothetical protein HO274_09995 [Ferrovum myxofaciens]|uniref:hypothetical protein n=1 Tax=Ferrovum myxofaciens TaxID=416213 RepID=UPI00235712FC|nr:hypothetical protein [Ferrovum myxofaciens]QKE41608.1 MAG: hypothetical protein HO274_09995 [Ferrovum myxofaciens]